MTAEDPAPSLAGVAAPAGGGGHTPQTMAAPSLAGAAAPAGATTQAQALQLMQAPSDEAKFAGLLVLVKHLNQHATPPDKDVRARVLDAVNPKFLARLLASPATDPNSLQFKGVALAVLAALSQDTSLVPRLRPLCKHVLGVLDEAGVSTGTGDVAQTQKVVEDCLFYLYALAQHDRSVACVEAVSTHQAFARVVAAMMHLRTRQHADTEKTQEPEKTKEETEAVENAAATTTTKAANDDNEEASSRLLREACATLREMLLLEGEMASQQQQAQPLSVVADGGESLVMLSQILEEDPTDLKLHVLHLLSLLLSHRRGPRHAAVWRIQPPALRSFGKHMRSALMQLLHGAFRETNRDPALAVLVHSLVLFGQGWAVEEEDEGGEANAKGTAAGFFVHALSAETRMAAEELESLANVGEDVLATDASLRKRLGRATEVLPLCLDGLDAVLRFLCGAGGGPECVVANTPPAKQWETFPGSTLLNMRASLHDAVGALLKLLQDGAHEWKQQGGSGAGELDQGLLLLHREAARFLSAILAEDEACMAAKEALGVLPYVMHLAEQGGGTGLVLPWVSRVLSAAAEDMSVVARLIDDCGMHLWLIQCLSAPASAKQEIDVLLLLHELLLHGSAFLLSDGRACFLAFHPEVLGLAPHLAASASSSSSSCYRLRLYQVWFLLALLWGLDEEGGGTERGLYGKEVLQRVAPPGSQACTALVDAVGEVLLEGMKRLQAPPPDSEEEEELAGLWREAAHLLSLAPEDLRRSVLRSLVVTHGEREVGGLEDELLLRSAASAVLGRGGK